MTRPIIDGITIPRFDRDSLLKMQAGGLTATVFMSSIWDGMAVAFNNIASARAILAENSDVALLVTEPGDIEVARVTGRVGVILGWQNTDGFGECAANVSLFQEAGLRTASVTFNSANAAGGGCYEPVDGGLTSLGFELVGACNDAGILLDLTHVGDRTAAQTLAASRKPLCYSHAHPRALKEHARNKTDEQMRMVADKGGVVGLGALRHFHRRGLDSDISDFVASVLHVIGVTGEDHVALGSDITPGQPAAFLEYTGRHKGIGRVMQNYEHSPALPGFATFADYPEVAERLSACLTGTQVDKFLSKNWLRLYDEVWNIRSK